MTAQRPKRRSATRERPSNTTTAGSRPRLGLLRRVRIRNFVCELFFKIRESVPWFVSDPRDKPMPAGGVLGPGGVPKGSSWREGAVGWLTGITRIALTVSHNNRSSKRMANSPFTCHQN